jgi:hypothetical protein
MASKRNFYLQNLSSTSKAKYKSKIFFSNFHTCSFNLKKLAYCKSVPPIGMGFNSAESLQSLQLTLHKPMEDRHGKVSSVSSTT